MKKSDEKITKRKETEAQTLATFQEENPSRYFSHKGKEEYDSYVKRAEYIYRDHFKFPPKMFQGARLIDFGAGTGENTIYLANWGATCTLVEMNKKAQDFSKEVFSKYANDKIGHTFIHSSIFDYCPQTDEEREYDIVHCRGVLSHTAAKEEAFQKIAGFVKPGGFFIFGDPNKAGGFQNMLQRFAVYHFASSSDEMENVCEKLFKEDIDRSEKAVPRTRRAIIFDRWVIQSQDDPSVAEVVSWAQASGLRLYSSYPPVFLPMLGDSIHHNPKCDPFKFTNLFSLAELAWMMQTDADADLLYSVNEGLAGFSAAFDKISGYVANFNANSSFDTGIFSELADTLKKSVRIIQPYSALQDKLKKFATEAVSFVHVVKEGNLNNVRAFIEKTKYLFKGACGVRHVDFIAYRPAAQ